MENYEGISVMSSGDRCKVEGNTLTSASSDVTSSLLGQLTSSVGPSVKQESGAKRLFVMTDISQIDAVQVSQYLCTILVAIFQAILAPCGFRGPCVLSL